MVVRLYITADSPGDGSGGGQVVNSELKALYSLPEDVVLISGREMKESYRKLPDTPFLWDLLAADQVSKVMGRDEVIHAHFYSGTFTQTVRLLKAHGVFVTYTCPAHDRMTSIEEFHRLGLAYPYAHIADDDLWELFSEGLRESDVVIAPSRLSAEFLKSQGCKHVKIVPHGLFSPPTPLPLPERFSVGYLGQVGPDKGLLYLIQAWGSLDYRDSTLLLAGRGTETLSPLITSSVNGGRFKLLGYVKESNDLYKLCSVYVQPSVCEAWGIEVGEAMAAGRPVIVSSGAGAADMVRDGVDGFIVSPRDPRAIADKIRWFREYPWKISTMGEKAREQARRFEWSILRGQYSKIWMEFSAEESLSSVEAISPSTTPIST